MSLNLAYDLLFKNIDMNWNCWIVSGRTFIFYMSIPCHDSFLFTVFLKVDLVTLTLAYYLFLRTLSLGHVFRVVIDLAFILFSCVFFVTRHLFQCHDSICHVWCMSHRPYNSRKVKRGWELRNKRNAKRQ